MTEDEFEYDPERGLWRPGRRTFIFLLGSAMVGAVLTKPTELWGRTLVDDLLAAEPGVGLFDASKYLKQVYGTGWYLGRDGKRVYRAEIVKATRERARADL